MAQGETASAGVSGQRSQVTSLSQPVRSREELLHRLCSTTLARVGWTFRDRAELATEWTKPPPPRVVVATSVLRPAEMARARLQDLPAVAAACLLVAGAIAVPISVATTGGGLAFVPRLLELVSPVLLGVGGWAAGVVVQERRTAERLARATEHGQRLLATEQQRWENDRASHEQAQHELLESTPEWSPIGVLGQPRVDVFGGSLRSWCGLLTTFLTSVVHPGRSVITIDLTNARIVDEARQLCSLAQRSTQMILLPSEQGAAHLVHGLDARAMVDLVVDLIHGPASTDRSEDRVIDTRILRAVCDALEPQVTPDRLHHALQELLGEPVNDPVLTGEEQARIATTLFSDEFVRQTHVRFRALEAYVRELRAGGGTTPPAAAASAGLECVVLSGEEQATTDFYSNLAIQWVTREVERRPVQTVVVAGADRVPLPLLERLAQRCERRDAQLFVLFQHLRDETTRFVGGGRAVGFMRLGNHLEAEAAASFIGRGYRFVLSQVTSSQGGQSSESMGSSHGGGTSTSTTYDATRDFLDHFLGPPATSRTDGHNTSWGRSLEFSEGTNWNVGATQQRVYEYQVEPTQLQGLPDYALLLVTPEPTGPRIRSVECCPDIATLPRVSPTPIDLANVPAGPYGEG